jgi:hypothetical protein
MPNRVNRAAQRHVVVREEEGAGGNMKRPPEQDTFREIYPREIRFRGGTRDFFSAASTRTRTRRANTFAEST